ncbi:hypothetical protein BJ165DRAFT_1504863 [Panaeolus papilionaceus]|nr:hypothetical protein BJ165DRAFT_1504863 [Panaeolus papilionaceus]
MKRPATPTISEAKRVKLIPFIPRLTRVPTQDVANLCNSKIPDESKCVVGRVKMWWPATEASKNKARAIVELGEGSNTRKIQLKLGSKHEEHLQLLTIRLHDHFRLSLRGAQLTTMKQIPKLCTHPFCLEIMNGFNIEWVHQNDDGTEDGFGVNCWAEEEPEEASQAGRALSDGWYTEDEDGDAQKGFTKVQTSEPKRKSQSPAIRSIEPQRDPISSSSRGAVSPGSAEAASHQGEPSSKFQGGFTSGMARYPAIARAEVGQRVPLIGVVVSASEPLMTRTGEWMRFLNIVDPSNYNPNDEVYQSIGFKVNIFSKKHKEWLPHPRIGDTVLLRNVKIQPYQDRITGTVVASGLQWAAFSPDSGKVHHGPPSSAPKRDRLADSNFGAEVTPYYSPGEAEISYCVKLSDWWREVRPKGFLVAEHQPARGVELPSFGIKRVHRLVQDAHPEVPPNGYFDCTVEVLRGFSGPNPQIHTLYVTDYTDNDGLRNVDQNAKWCPPGLTQAVLQLEAWDAAANIARDMQPGQYYSIKNVRMKIAQSGYLEAKVVQANKITHLAGELAEKNPHLKALLERKKKRMTVVAHSSPEIQHKIIGDIEEGSAFNCTVELLHVAEESGKVCLFVTDYTDLSSLVGVGAGEPWAEGLQRKIMKIYLSDQQSNAGRALVVGTFYRINKLTLSNNPVYGCYCCTLAGSEKLIHKLNSNMVSNEFLNGVIRRRSRWLAMVKQGAAIEEPKPKPKKSSIPKKTLPSPVAPPPLPKPSIPYTLFKEISFADDKPHRYKVYAQVLDFHPTQLRDAFYQVCAQCRKEIPKTRTTCFDCLDVDRQYVQYHYQVYTKIQDEDGAEIFVSINDQSPFLKGLIRGDIALDRDCYLGLVNRLRTIMSHTLDTNGQKVETNQRGTFHLFELDSWVVPEGKRAFCLRRLIEETA